jgi:tRNA A-37 threonylcarbamoyl transferase component Bud32
MERKIKLNSQEAFLLFRTLTAYEERFKEKYSDTILFGYGEKWEEYKNIIDLEDKLHRYLMCSKEWWRQK